MEKKIRTNWIVEDDWVDVDVFELENWLITLDFFTWLFDRLSDDSTEEERTEEKSAVWVEKESDLSVRGFFVFCTMAVWKPTYRRKKVGGGFTLY